MNVKGGDVTGLRKIGIFLLTLKGPISGEVFKPTWGLPTAIWNGKERVSYKKQVTLCVYLFNQILSYSGLHPRILSSPPTFVYTS